MPWIVKQEIAGRGDAPETKAMTAVLLDMVVDDFRRFQPDAVVVDESPGGWGLTEKLDIMAWFKRDPRMAEILGPYERVAAFTDPIRGESGPRYGIYRRQTE